MTTLHTLAQLGRPRATLRSVPADGKLLAAGLTGAFASYLIVYITFRLCSGEQYPFGDFFAIWSYAKLLVGHPAASLYDFGTLHDTQVGLGLEPASQYPFPYPPSFIFAIWLLQPLSYGVAFLLWAGTTFSLYAAAALGWSRPHPVVALAAVLAPTTTITLVSGQGGFLAAALLIGGIRLVRRRPILAGVLFGLLTYKPQLGLLVPVALLAAGQFRCIGAAVATACLLAALSSFAFGAAIWPDWLAALPAYQAMFARSTVAHVLMTPVLTNLQALGAPDALAKSIQLLVGLAAATAVWVSYRRGPRDLAAVILLAATCLATPHAFVYDLPILTGAISLYLGLRLRSGEPFDRLELLAVTAALAFPVVMTMSTSHVPVSGLAMLLFLGIVLRQRRRAIGAVKQASVSWQPEWLARAPVPSDAASW